MARKKIKLEKISPVFTYILLKVPDHVYESESDISIDLKTKDELIKGYMADGFPLEVIKVGPQVQSFKVGDGFMCSNLSYPAKVMNIEENGEFWMTREMDGAFNVDLND